MAAPLPLCPSCRVWPSLRVSTCPAPFLNPLDALSSAVRSRGAGAGGPKHEMLTRPSFPGPIYEHDGTHHRRATTSPAALLLAVGAARPGPPTPTAGRRPTARHRSPLLPQQVCAKLRAARTLHLCCLHALSTCQACDRAAMLHTMPAHALRDRRRSASPRVRTPCWQVALVR